MWKNLCFGSNLASYSNTPVVNAEFRRMCKHISSIVSNYLKLIIGLTLSVITHSAQATETSMPEGMKGWSYFISLNKDEGYARTPVEACEPTAMNHFGVGVMAVIPTAGARGPMYDCIYKNPFGGLVWTYGQSSLYCEYGYAAKAPGVCVKWSEPPRPTSCDPDQPGFACGNPIQLASGVKVQTEMDLLGVPNGALRVSRIYRSLRASAGGQSAGQGWSFSFDRTFYTEPRSVGPSSPARVVKGTLGDGTEFYFSRKSSGVYVSATDKNESLHNLNELFDDWILTTRDGNIERFKRINGDYLLVSSHTKEGVGQFYTYDADNKLTSIADASGRALKLTWAGRAVKSIASDTASIHYSYDFGKSTHGAEIPGTEQLVTVTFYDKNEQFLADKRYHYEDANYRHLLTGITDENGTRFATYAYNSTGQAVLSEHSGGANRIIVAYPEKSKRLIFDALGTLRTIDLVYGLDSWGHIGRISHPAGAGSAAGFHTLNYDSLGHAVSSIDVNGTKTCYKREPIRGLIVKQISGITSARCPVGNDDLPPACGWKAVSTRWHPDFPLETEVASPGRITTYAYNGQLDASGNLISCARDGKLPNGAPLVVLCAKTVQATLDPSGVRGFAAQLSGRPRTWLYSYNASGQLLKVVGPTNASGQSEITTLMYYQDTTATHSLGDLASVRNSIGETAEFLEYTQVGLPKKIKRATGDIVTMDYDARQRITSRTIEDGNGGVEATNFTYDRVGQLIRIESPDSTVVIVGYDDAHRVTSIKDGAGNSVHLTLNPMGDVTRQEVRDVAGNLVREINLAYDSLNRVASVWRTSEMRATTFQYDPIGNLTGIMDALGRVTHRRFDSLNRLVEDQLLLAVSENGLATVGYSFDFQNQLRAVRDPRKLITQYTVDGYGGRTAQNSPDTGVSNYSFDDAGNLVTSQDARGMMTSYRYDASRRVTEIGSSRFSYGKPGTSATGRLTAMTDDSGNSSFTYDGFGRPQTRVHIIGSGPSAKQFMLAYTYGKSGSSTGHMTSMTYPSGNRIVVAYNNNGRAASVSLLAPNAVMPTTILSDIGYTALGEVERWNWGVADQLNLHLREFDVVGRIKRYSLGHPRNNGITRTVSYDDVDRITQISHADGRNAALLDQRYTYDGLDRLINVEGPRISQAFDYDASGNRIRARFGAGSYLNTIDPASNRLVRTNGPVQAKINTYDKAGNLISDGTGSYTYGVDGRMIASTAGGIKTVYSYNGFGERVAKSSSTGSHTYYVYDSAGRLVGEYDRNGKILQETVYLGDLPVAVLKPGAGTMDLYAIYADHISTPRVITRLSDHRMMWRWDNVDPFGMQQPDESPDGLPPFVYNLRFPGQIYDKKTNNHYNYFRDYDPQLGRYVQSDPIGLEGGINTYGYVGGNPVSITDPLGLRPGLALRLPARVEAHNRWNDPHTQMKAEYKDYRSDRQLNWNDPLPRIPQPPKPWCRLICPSDSPYACGAPPKEGLPRMSSAGEQCTQICINGPVATAIREPDSDYSPESGARDARTGDYARLLHILRGAK